ncbi:MAG: class I SAM-dependent methyltransferase, partial [Dehalococcoidia bacterium]|nr:class I SAM-dependent methyltransferase [Dehalococcoidia bacterium]
MTEINLLDKYPVANRPIEERGNQITEEHRSVARQFGKDFFDGGRLFGYGGYGYHPRFWTDTVARFRDHYDLAPDASILDVGCAKGFMIYDFKLLIPDATLAGIDVSEYAIENAKQEVNPNMRVANANELTFEDNSFDLVIS